MSRKGAFTIFSGQNQTSRSRHTNIIGRVCATPSTESFLWISLRSPPLDRLDDYFNHVRQSQLDRLQKYGRLLGCPFVSLGSELSTQDESIRLMAQKISECKCCYLEATLRDAIERGDISAADPKELASELRSYLVGLIQEAKIANDVRVLDRLKPGAHRLLGLPTTTAAV